ncbi:transcriptional attenuator, LytR family [Paenibacillus sp. yr247]|uniref:LCP family protein n=1 Tax=Paenibacillus sp. yr247 TaxID=1761880 RepID=UPI00088FB4E0|nr:LCP family protein [Paenibacillus sp. yr247]SDN32777.1 transcriptional attenuator, LytR family [Paenibacillus sp. yr247]
MNRWVVYTAGFILLGLISIGGFIYWKYEPDHHFKQMEIPVLSKPVVSIETTPLLREQGTEKNQLNDQSHIQSSSVDTKVIQAFNVLILGIDARGEENSRSDVMMVMHIIPSERKVNIVSIPRDTRVKIEGVGYTKINHAHILGELKGGNQEGTKAALQAASNFLDVPINYYVKTDFKGFENFIDTIGGVNVEVKNDINLSDNQITLAKGIQHIDGKLALSLARERYSQPDGDFGRQREQSQILKNVAQEILKPEHVGEIANLLRKVKKDIVDTNFQDDDLISLAWLFKGMTTEDFTYKQIPGHSGYDMDPLVQLQLYYWIPDSDEVKELSDTLLKDKPSN